MSIRAAVVAACAVILVAAGIGFPASSPTRSLTTGGQRSNGVFRFQVGSVLRYSLSGRYEIALNDFLSEIGPRRDSSLKMLPAATTRETSPSIQRSTVTGELFVRIFQLSTRGAIAGIQFQDVQCPEEMEANPRCREIYEAPALIELSYAGEISFLQFSNVLALSEERQLSGILEPFSVQIAGDSTWEAQVSDSHGEAVYSYAREESGNIRRKKLDYLSVSFDGDFIDDARVKNSLAEFTPDPDLEWLANASVSEELELRGSGSSRIVFQTQSRLARAADSKEPPTWVHGTLKEFKDLLHSQSKRLTSRIKEERAKKTATLIKSDTKGIQRRLAHLVGKLQPTEVLSRCEELTEWLKSNPDQITRIPTLLLQAEYDDDARSRGVYALQNVGTAAAQNALLSIVRNPSHSESTRRASLGALAFVPISEDTAASLWSMRQEWIGGAGGVYGEMATMVLGGAAKSLLAENSERAHEIVARLMHELDLSSRSNRTRDVENVLIALGNSSSPATLDTISNYLTSKSDTVRRAAALALQSSEVEPNVDMISERLLEEETPAVRAALVETIFRYPVSEYSFSVAAQLFIEEDDSKARLAIARYLSKASEAFPAQRGHIRALLRSETDPIIAKTLGSRVNPELVRQGG